MIETIWGTTNKPVASMQLAEFFTAHSEMNGTLYIGYPIIGTPDGAHAADGLLLSPEIGLIVFNIVEGKDIVDFQEVQDESYNKLTSKLTQHKSLMQGRELRVAVHVITFAPAVHKLPSSSEEYSICNLETIEAFLKTLKWKHSEYFPAAAAVIQAISTIRKGKKKREVKDPDSLGSRLKTLEDSIANLDNNQSAAVIETHEGVQRIRGLAGSGKTIVLALKVAYLHITHRDWEIAVTFNTRSLKGQFERLINTFVIEQANEEPDWEKVHIINAWGAPGGRNREGIYFNFCKDHNLQWQDYRSALRAFGPGHEFEGACEKAIHEANGNIIKPAYDAILVDEAQDFSPNFLLLCYEYLREPKRLVYAYDELQNLTSNSLPAPEEIFGKNTDGTPRVQFHAARPGKPRQDIILETCYRNSRPVLTTAHSLGFGIYRDKGLVQIFENKELWLDIGYAVASGELEDGHEVRLERTAKTSPEFLEAHTAVDELIQFKAFDNQESQTKWLVEAIITNLKRDELQPEDIIVINPEPLTTREQVSTARRLLLEQGINSNLAGVSTSADVFFESDNITFTGVFRAKGNEAGMVYIINAQDCYSSALRRDTARIRNRLFTAITRSKGWVMVLGVGTRMRDLEKEFVATKKEDFGLKFVYPTAAQREKLNIVNRDMSEQERKEIHQKGVNLKDIIESLESGETLIEDYPEETVRKLRRLLSRLEKE